ncbi:MAG: ATP-binding protein [Candidatus Polarisedimenticolia bacterium]
MGERTRALAWSKTPVGPVELWPQSLRTAVSICLGSRYPIVLWWGRPAYTMFYNDAYIPCMGITKHPGFLGRSGRECWQEIWPTIGPMLEGVFETGEATWSEDLLLVMHRNLPREETYFTFSYSPLRRESGMVGGIFCACYETTGRVIGERQLRTLRDLGGTVTEAKEEGDACRAVARVLAANPADIPFALIYLADAECREAGLVASFGLQDGSRAAPGRIDLSSSSPSSAAWPLSQVARTGAAELVLNPSLRHGPLSGGPWPESPQGALILPILTPGQTAPAGFLVAGLSPRRVVSAEYRGFLDLVAGHIGTAVANARAYEHEKRRAEELAELDRAKTAFFSNVSHEFRTPLTLMLGPIEDLLAERVRDGGRDHELLEVVHRNGQRLLRLVNTLLDFSRIEAGRIQASYDPIDLASFTADLASSFRSACERAGLDLNVSCPALPEAVYVDREMWEKIVLNLLSNAFKFTFQGEIAVTLRALDRAVALEVRDTGTGIPADELPKVFERFHRVENARGRTHEGSGIGLALVQELVRLHGGSIAAESMPDQGTTFTVTIPLGSGHLPPDRIGARRTQTSTATGAIAFVEEALRWLPGVGQGAEEGPSEAPALFEDFSVPLLPRIPGEAVPRVLVADDNADMREYLRRLLAGRYHVETVPDGVAALERIRLQPPDIVLTDVMMPNLDGLGLVRAVRVDPHRNTVPMILLSARAGEEARIEALEAGADDYLIKPFSTRELLARLESQLELARVRRRVLSAQVEAKEAIARSEERYRSMVSVLTDVPWVADAQGALSEPQPAWEAYTGQSWPHHRGTGWLDAIHPDDRARVWQLWSEARRKRTVYESSGRLWHAPSRQWRHFVSRATPVTDPDGSVREWVGACTDVHESRMAMDALRVADRHKNEFLATLAHELRNPLAPIRNSVLIMRRSPGDGVVTGRALDTIQRQLKLLVRLVDDLMDVSRITRNRIDLRREPVELASIVQSALEMSRPLIEASGHELTVSLPSERVVLNADLTRMAQVVANLLNNAAKYTPERGRIWLTSESLAGEVILRVRDTGIGIPPETLPRIFDLFTQADASIGRSQGGLGIGLMLVRSLVEMHGGTVEASSSGPHKGSEFTVRLPMMERIPSSKETGAASDRPASAPARRVLVVDDNRDAAETLGSLLTMMGHDVHTVHDGEAALNEVRSFAPEVALLDIGMPGMNGYELARRLRALPGLQEIVLVSVTGWGQEEDRRRSHEAGFDLHLTKPADLAAIEQILASLES